MNPDLEKRVPREILAELIEEGTEAFRGILEKLRDLSLGPITLFQRPICVSIRLRWLYPVATCQAMRPLLRIWAIWRSRTGG